MKNKKAQILITIVLIFLLAVLIFLIYILYQYIPGKPEQLIAIIEKPKLEIGNLSYKVEQFYPNMKFNHNDISYKISEDCSEEKKARMLDAFNELSNRVSIISFYPTEGEADIDVSCTKQAKHTIKEDFFIAGEGGAKEIIQTGRYYVIIDGLVLLYDNIEGIRCDWPNIELHELLHVFGFKHSQDSNSLMYPYLESCGQKLDESIIQDLKELYGKENLADLYFESVEVVKRGRYLDFNITIRNSGTIKAEQVSLTVLDDEESVESFELRDIPFGGGMNFQVTNLKLKSRSSDNIKLVIDAVDLIEELDEDNNVAELVFG